MRNPFVITCCAEDEGLRILCSFHVDNMLPGSYVLLQWRYFTAHAMPQRTQSLISSWYCKTIWGTGIQHLTATRKWNPSRRMYMRFFVLSPISYIHTVFHCALRVHRFKRSLPKE